MQTLTNIKIALGRKRLIEALMTRISAKTRIKKQ